MSDLRGFFSSLGRYLADPGPEAAEAWIARHPGWEPAPARLGVYGRHARAGVGNMLGKVFSGCQAALGDAGWEDLLRAYYRTRPATHFEVNQAGAEFPAFVAARPDLPACLPELAVFEWAILTTYQSGEELPARVDALTVNPTLQTHEHQHRLCPFLAGQREGLPAPEPELALTWRHPGTLRTRYMTAGPPSLLALKIVLEQIPLERAAAEGGVEVPAIQRVLDEAVEKGLLLAPIAG